MWLAEFYGAYLLIEGKKRYFVFHIKTYDVIVSADQAGSTIRIMVVICS